MLDSPRGRFSHRPLFVSVCAIAAVFVASCTPPPPPDVLDGETLRVLVEKVRDGDSLLTRVDGRHVEVRLHGIDAPEFDQPWGEESRAALVALVLGESVRLTVTDTDRFGRKIAVVRRDADREPVNLRLVRDGHAWVFRRYEKRADWLDAEQAARDARTGLWQSPAPTPPWEWRDR